MNNKPKYNFFKNTKYAIDGFFCAVKNENFFKIELFFAIFIVLGIVYIDIELVEI